MNQSQPKTSQPIDEQATPAPIDRALVGSVNDSANNADNSAAPAVEPDARLDDLAQIIQAYTQVTDKLEKSHSLLGSEVERLQKELASTDAQLQRSRRLAALGEMAAGIAHEVRNPLAAIQLYAGMLEEDLVSLEDSAVDETARLTLQGASSTARKIASAVRGLDAIVNDVLVFSREMTPRPMRVSVPVVLGRAVESIWPVLDQAGIRLVQPDADERPELNDLFLLVDPELLQQAMLNLLRNAADAMMAKREHQHGPDGVGVLTLDARRDGTHAILIIKDTGPGINEESIDRIFNPFFTTRDTGTGLGLAIVHRIADAHGGAVAVHNDNGAVFELSMPAAPETSDSTESHATQNQSASKADDEYLSASYSSHPIAKARS